MAYVLDTNSIKSQLYNMNRDYYGEQSWRKAYLDTALASEQAMSSVAYDYGSAINEAYASAMKQESAIQGSALGQGYKDALLYDTESALREAFDSYRQNYQSAVSTIQQETATANQAITDELTKQAQYTTKMFDSSFNYLQDLFNLYNDGEIVDDKGQVVNIFATEDNWKKYTTTDENGQIRLKTKDELLAGGADNEGLVDKEGNLTIAGIDFFDQMLNEQAFTGRGKSFGSWLRETDEDLYNWAQAYNPYDYTEAGTNFGSFKTMFGMSSTDEQYQFLERFGGWSESKITSKFEQFNSKVNTLIDSAIKSPKDLQNPDKVMSSVKGIADELHSMAKEFGLQDELDFDTLYALVEKSYNDAISGKEGTTSMNWSNAGQMAAFTSTGAALGSVLPGIGTAAGALVGAISGLITSIITTSISTKEYEKHNAAVYDNLRKQFLSISNQMLNYSLNKRQKMALSK